MVPPFVGLKGKPNRSLLPSSSLFFFWGGGGRGSHFIYLFFKGGEFPFDKPTPDSLESFDLTKGKSWTSKPFALGSVSTPAKLRAWHTRAEEAQPLEEQAAAKRRFLEQAGTHLRP